jgi:DNA-binding transcriptional MerR regulator
LDHQNVETAELTLSISAVERDTGLSKDTLRVWERRYGFPNPGRDANGERIYPAGQVERLRLIKRLMDRGHRPGRIVPLGTDELASLAAAGAGARVARQDTDAFLHLIKAHQLGELRRHLAQALMRQGLQAFVTQTVAPLNQAVGEAWMRGELAVFEEHLYTEQLRSVLRNALSPTSLPGRAPRVLLTTFPTEQHEVGLLMLEALLAVEGAACVPLGTQTPLPDIVRAAQAHRVHIVALSFSAAFNDKQAALGLAELRAMLPAPILIWAGGACIERMRRAIDGVDLIGGFAPLLDKVRAWRTLHASA